MQSTCHITTAHPVRDARIHFRECRSLVKAGFQVHLIAPDDGTRPDPRVTFHPLRLHRSRLARALVGTISAYRLARKLRADVYHLHDPELLPIGVLLAWRGRAVVYDAHEDLPLDVLSKPWLPFAIRPLLARLAGVAESFLVRPLAAVVTATAPIAARLGRFNPNTWTVRNLPTEEFLPADHPPDSTEPFVVYAGLISRQRGIDVMLAAVAAARVRLRLIGRFEDARTEADVCGSVHWSRVDYRGRVDPEQVPALLRGAVAGLCILQSTQAFVEALPMKLLEYKAAGIPVIASDFPAWRALFGEGDSARFVDPQRPEEVAEAIAQLAAPRVATEEAPAQRRTGIRGPMNWETESETLVAVYKTVLSRRRSS